MDAAKNESMAFCCSRSGHRACQTFPPCHHAPSDWLPAAAVTTPRKITALLWSCLPVAHRSTPGKLPHKTICWILTAPMVISPPSPTLGPGQPGRLASITGVDDGDAIRYRCVSGELTGVIDATCEVPDLLEFAHFGVVVESDNDFRSRSEPSEKACQVIFAIFYWAVVFCLEYPFPSI